MDLELKTLITIIERGRGETQADLLILEMSISTVPVAIKHPELMRFLPKIKVIGHGGERISLSHSRSCSGHGMEFSRHA